MKEYKIISEKSVMFVHPWQDGQEIETDAKLLNKAKKSILLNIMFHATMGRFQLELIYYFTYFSPLSHLTLVCFFPVGLSLLIQHFQQVL